MIKGLRDKFPAINVARETDIETHLFAQQIAMSLMAAGINVRQYRRAADVHTASLLIYEPLGFDGSRPRSVEPLVEIFRKVDPSVMLIAGPMPPDIPASSEIPMILVGGRLVLPTDPITLARLIAELDGSDADNRPHRAHANSKP
jgi:hypothetical protein